MLTSGTSLGWDLYRQVVSMEVKPVEATENDALCRFMRHVRIVVFLILVDIHGLGPSNILCEQANSK